MDAKGKADQTMLGDRLRFARKAVGLRAADAARALGLSPSGISEMEKGKREPKVSQLSKLAELYRRSIEFFLEAAPPPADAVLWRCKPEDDSEALKIQREFYKLCEDYRQVEELTGELPDKVLPSDSTPRDRFGYPQAETLAVRVWKEMDLGPVPAEMLRHVLEERYYAKMFALPLQGPTSSLCTISEIFGPAILLNQNSCHWRRNYDLAHELFHLLTWQAFGHQGSSQEADESEESFANTFASHLLLPRGSVLERISRFQDLAGDQKMTFADLHGIARTFDVSAEAVVYRLAGILRWPREKTQGIVDRLGEFYSPRKSEPIDVRPKRFVHLTAQAYRQGLISFSKAAKYLRLSHKDAQPILEPPEDGVDLNATIEVAAN